MTPDDIKNYGEIALQVIGVLSVVAAITPTPIDNAILVALKKLINAGAFNWLEAENKRKPGDPTTIPKEQRRKKKPGPRS
jgi:hypothetical protein